MNLRDRGKFGAAAWDWSIFNACFSGGIRMSDIDGIVEVRGHVLIIEAKPDDLIGLSAGQARLFRALASKPGITVAVLYGNPGNPTRWYRFAGEGMRPCTLPEVQEWAAQWYAQAKGD